MFGKTTRKEAIALLGWVGTGLLIAAVIILFIVLAGWEAFGLTIGLVGIVSIFVSNGLMHIEEKQAERSTKSTLRQDQGKD